MLAYYINLIKQQEEEEEKKRDRSSSVSMDEEADVVERSEKNSVVSEDQPVKRPVGRPRKHPVEEVVTKITPKKSAKQLELDEAERIISTILERRPGRAEFKVPVVVEKEPSEEEVDNRSPPKKSAKTLALEEAERIIATIERRPTATSAKAVDDAKLVRVGRTEEKKIDVKPIVVEEVVQKRGPGRPPKKLDHPPGADVKVQPAEIEVKVTQVVPEEVVKKRGPGRPPKNSVQPQPVVVSPPPAESPKREPKTVTPRKRPPSPEKPKAQKFEQSAEPLVPPTTSLNVFSFTFHHGMDRKPNWWRERIGLELFPIDDDLDHVVKQVVKRAKQTSEDVFKHAMESSSDPFVARMVLHVE